jgi:hypothetical protein
MGAYTWSEPRQKEIYEGLLAVGEGPAAFYRDACQMMANPTGFDGTTHVVGHLVREIESALRAGLRTFAQTSEHTGHVDSKGKHAAEIRQIWSGLDCLRTIPRLGFGYNWPAKATHLLSTQLPTGTLWRGPARSPATLAVGGMEFS